MGGDELSASGRPDARRCGEPRRRVRAGGDRRNARDARLRRRRQRTPGRRCDVQIGAQRRRVRGDRSWLTTRSTSSPPKRLTRCVSTCCAMTRRAEMSHLRRTSCRARCTSAYATAAQSSPSPPGFQAVPRRAGRAAARDGHCRAPAGPRTRSNPARGGMRTGCDGCAAGLGPSSRHGSPFLRTPRFHDRGRRLRRRAHRQTPSPDHQTPLV